MTTNKTATMDEGELSSLTESFYRPPASSLTEGIEEHDLRAFVGNKADHYLKKWAPMIEGRDDEASFSLPACLLTSLWLAYRKMYRFTLIYYGIILLKSIAEAAFFAGLLGRTQAPSGFALLTTVGTSIIFGVYGNRWYFSHAKQVVADVRTHGLEAQAHEAMLAKRGGTSLVAALGLSFMFIVILFVVLYFVLFPWLKN